MKDVLRCTSCGANYPADHARNWGRSAASDGLGDWPRCGNRVPNPAAPRAKDAQGNEQVPEQICGGMLSVVSVADNASVEDPKPYDRKSVVGPLGVWRAEKAKPPVSE